MAGSLYAMPIILLNMGGEMTYILQQRLFAQSVEDEKARKVLQDVVKAMYSPQFLSELFKPQEMYTAASTKQIFEKLAHSSIMRLNKSSMDKLFDLMSMGFKKQLITCNSPQMLLHVTLTHLESIKAIVQDPVMVDSIQNCEDKCIALYGNLSSGQWLLLRQSLLRFVQGKKIKVSLFLQQGLQTVDGSLVVDLSGKLPYGTEVPGKIRIFEGNTMVKSISFDSPAALMGCVENDEIFDVNSSQGKNVYMKDKDGAPVAETKDAGDRQSPAAVFTQAMRVLQGALRLSGRTGSRRNDIEVTSPSRPAPEISVSAKAELNMLADLLGIGGSKDSDEKPFKFNLFPDDGYSSSEGKGVETGVLNFDIDGTAGAKSVQRYMEDLDLKDDPKGSKLDDDDLLALMDSQK